MRLAERRDRREEFLAKLKREKVDLEREHLRAMLNKSPETPRTNRDISDCSTCTYIYYLMLVLRTLVLIVLYAHK